MRTYNTEEFLKSMKQITRDILSKLNRRQIGIIKDFRVIRKQWFMKLVVGHMQNVVLRCTLLRGYCCNEAAHLSMQSGQP
jgi:hypothetical protein